MSTLAMGGDFGGNLVKALGLGDGVTDLTLKVGATSPATIEIRRMVTLEEGLEVIAVFEQYRLVKVEDEE
jgi:hypothetical protein